MKKEYIKPISSSYKVTAIYSLLETSTASETTDPDHEGGAKGTGGMWDWQEDDDDDE